MMHPFNGGLPVFWSCFPFFFLQPAFRRLGSPSLTRWNVAYRDAPFVLFPSYFYHVQGKFAADLPLADSEVLR